MRFTTYGRNMMHRNIRLGIISLLVATLIGVPAVPTTAQATVGVVIEAQVGNIGLYASPSLTQAPIRTIGKGNRMLWTTERTVAEGRQWFYVQISGQAGWISPEDGSLSLADPTRITPGIDRSAVIRVSTNPMTLYAAPGRGNPVLATLFEGTVMRVEDAPVVTDLYTWWKVRVSDTGQEGWVVDTGYELAVDTPLTVYGYQVCDNFDLKANGASGWDSIVPQIPALIGTGEQVVCLASTKMNGSNSPVVVILSRKEVVGTVDALRLFEQRGGVWTRIFETFTAEFNRTDRLSLHTFGGDRPMLLWGVRVDGTGGILLTAVLRYNSFSGTIDVIAGGESYKGSLQVLENTLTLISANYLPNEPNCCPSGMERTVLVWQVDPLGTGSFALLAKDILPLPFAIQSRR
ncbi:MAG: hypothetical protein OHK0023_11430 [Anaerolineae bacterium]